MVKPMDKPISQIPEKSVLNATGRVTRSQLRRKQAQQLGPLVGTHHMIVLPERKPDDVSERHAAARASEQPHNADANRKHKHRKPRIEPGLTLGKTRGDTSQTPGKRQTISKSKPALDRSISQNSIISAPADTTDDVDGSCTIKDHVEDISSDCSETYSDDEFCADDEADDDLQVYEETSIVELQPGGPGRSRRNSFSLPDLREGQNSLVGSSNPSSVSVHSDGVQCKSIKTLQHSYGGAGRGNDDLSLPQIVNLSQSSSTDESTDDSYREPLTPRSKAASVNHNSLPELSHSVGVSKLGTLTNFATPRGVDIVFTTDSDNSAPNTFRGFDLKGKDVSESLPQIYSRTLVSNSPRHTQASTPLSSLARNKQGLSTSRMVKENTGTWLYNKSQKKVELRLVSTNYK